MSSSPGSLDIAAIRCRITDLKSQYAAFGTLSHSQWNEDFAQQEIDLKRFRADSAYLWQHRDGNDAAKYLLTYFYWKSSPHKDLLQLCCEDESFGASGIHVDGTFATRDRLDSVAEIGFLRDALPSLIDSEDLRILDIGAGYGRLGWRLHQCLPKAQITLVDAIPESTAISEAYLTSRNVSDRVRVVPLPQIEQQLAHNPPQVALAVNSLSECTAPTNDWWLGLLAKYNVPNLVVVPHALFDQGRELYSREIVMDDRVSLVPILRKHEYMRSLMAPKYADEAVQQRGVSPTYFHLFTREGAAQ